MRLKCIHCGKEYSLSDENAGAHFKCRRCGKISPVVALTDGVTEATATDNAQIDTARQRSTAAPAVVCSGCGKTHRLPSDVAAGKYRCSACGASMPVERADAQSSRADQVVWAEVVAEPRATRDMPTKPATQGSSYDLFSEVLPPTSGHVLSSSPAVDVPPTAAIVDESDSPYRLAPVIAEAVPVQQAATAKPGPKPKSAASKKRKRSRSQTDFQPLLRTIGGGAAVIVGVLLVLWGLLVLFDTSDSGRFGTRRPFRCIGAGISLIAFGCRLLVGQSTSQD